MDKSDSSGAAGLSGTGGQGTGGTSDGGLNRSTEGGLSASGSTGSSGMGASGTDRLGTSGTGSSGLGSTGSSSGLGNSGTGSSGLGASGTGSGGLGGSTGGTESYDASAGTATPTGTRSSTENDWGYGATGNAGYSTGRSTGTTPGGATGTGASGVSSSMNAGAAESAASDDDFEGWDSAYYRRHYESNPSRPTTGSYDTARTGYQLGHRAASTPNYSGRRFEEIEVELEGSYGGPSKWEQVRDYARHSFEWKTVLGGLALAAGGWWAGKALYSAISEMNEEDEQDCRVYYESHPARTGVTYDRARTGYMLGYVAARNPEYTGRGWDEVDTHLRTGFTGGYAGEYDTLRDFTRRGYERGTTRSRGGSL